jgi:hypothetical protein
MSNKPRTPLTENEIILILALGFFAMITLIAIFGKYEQ